MNAAPFDLVIFDNDGVLVDSERLITVVEARVLTELGWPMDQAEVVRRWVGRTSAEQLAEVRERLGDDGVALFEERLEREAAAVFARDLEPVPGVLGVLQALAAAQVPVCVASSGTPDAIAAKLAKTGLTGWFGDRVFSSTQVAHGKPAPDVFLLAAERCGVAPARCAVVEDAVPGVRGGVAAGMTVLGYGGGLVAPALLAEAGATVFPAMPDLVPLLLGGRAR